MNNEGLKIRTKQFSVRIVKFVVSFQEARSVRPLLDQLLRSGTSVGANYRALCRSRSEKDFLNKLKIVEEETDEALFWLELLEESGISLSEEQKLLKKEALELLRIFVTALKTTRARYNLKPL